MVSLHANSQIGPFLQPFFLFSQTCSIYFEKDRVKTRPVLKQAWVGQKLRVNTKLEYLVHVGKNLMFVKKLNENIHQHRTNISTLYLFVLKVFYNEVSKLVLFWFQS